jgi:hypothetical protein
VTIRGPFAIVALLLLFLSLAANLLIAGFLAARATAPRAPADVERVVATGVRGLPQEIQRAVVEETRAKRPELRARLQAVEQAQQRMYQAMRAQPFDEAALATALGDYRDKTTALQAAGQAILADAVAKAPIEVRRRIRPPQRSLLLP